VTIGDVVVPKVKQGTPHTDFTYIDIGSVNNKTKQIESAKELAVGSKIPSRAQQHLTFRTPSDADLRIFPGAL
jgi:hypothetical protein